MGPSRHLWFLPSKQRLLDQNYKSLWVPDLAFYLCMQKSAPNTRIASLNGFQPSSVFFVCKKKDFLTRITSVYGSQSSPVVLCMLNSVISTRITSLYGSQSSPVVLCMLISVISTRITSLYRSQPSSVVFARKTAPFGPELQVSKGPRPHLLFCVCKTAW